MARHITEIEINTYRGITNLEIKNLADINILVGDNNSGKTSVLEVIMTLNGIDNLFVWSKISRRDSGLLFYDAFSLLFNSNAIYKKIAYSFITEMQKKITVNIDSEIEQLSLTTKDMDDIEGMRNSHAHRQISIFDDDEMSEEMKDDEKLIDVGKLNLLININNLPEIRKEIWSFQRGFLMNGKFDHNYFNVDFISPTQHSNSSLFLSQVLDNSELYLEMLEILKEFDDKIISINSDRLKNSFSNMTIYKILSGNFKEAMPLGTYGDGMKKAILLMSAVVKAKDGILLIDEFETALHTKAMNDIYSWIIKTCKKLNVQLFMTTHSIEALEKILNCDETYLDDIRVITLYKNNDKTVGRVLDGKKALEVKNELGLELR